MEYAEIIERLVSRWGSCTPSEVVDTTALTIAVGAFGDQCLISYSGIVVEAAFDFDDWCGNGGDRHDSHIDEEGWKQLSPFDDTSLPGVYDVTGKVRVVVREEWADDPLEDHVHEYWSIEWVEKPTVRET